MKKNLFFLKEKGRGVYRNFLKLTIFCCFAVFLSAQSLGQTTVLLEDPIGKWEGLDSPELSVYPNPATDLVHVVPPVGESISYFEILDLNGTVLVATTVSGEMSLIADLSAGSYVLRVTTDASVYHKTLVIN